MIIKLAYCEGKGDTLYKQLFSYTNNANIDLISYDEDYYKEKKDSFKLKGSCGARLTPFCAIYDDTKNLIKAFYSETGECTFNNIKDFIDESRKISG
ncbi:hypothetical protein [Intestinibacter sp.]|uniref:hypothetical protein n=1 Tax=Intestinibacter sp. TaxID=1965304 RepID=UPI003F17043D